MEITRKLAVTVGALFAAAAVVGFLAVVFLGGQSLLFVKTVRYHAVFPDVGGLREGAVVRLGGRDVGDVTDVAFGPVGAGGVPTLVVTLRLRAHYADLVRKDSRARIGTQGLLGDKLLEVTLGSPSQAKVPDGGWLDGEPFADPTRLIGVATDALDSARSTLARLDDLTRRVAESGAVADLEATARGLRRIEAAIEDGPGTAHELIYGTGLASDARAALRAYGRAGLELESAAGRVDRLAAAVDIEKVRGATEDLARVAADVRAGRGTLGGLLEDPTLYEETKRLLVNIERNRVLKALARLVVSDEAPDKIMDARPEDVVVHPRPAPRAQAQEPGRLRQ